jgi:hypothetical protein
MSLRKSFPLLLVSLLLSITGFAQPVVDVYDYYRNPQANKPLTADPHKWPNQPAIQSWEAMDQAYQAAVQAQDGYGMYQLAYLEYVHNYTVSTLNPKTMLYKAFEVGKSKGDPYLMYWVTELEGTVYFRFEYLQRRRNHAVWTDSVASARGAYRVLNLLADLNDKCYQQMRTLAAQYLQCAYLKDETYGLLPYDLRPKALEMARNAVSK